MFIPSKNQPERHLSSCRKPTVHSASMTVAEATGIKAFFTSESWLGSPASKPTLAPPRWQRSPWQVIPVHSPGYEKIRASIGLLSSSGFNV
jgi:hypothetical protein